MTHPQRSTLFISDLHLDPIAPKTTQAFIYFIDHIAFEADALYILGDFFEVFIGDDDNTLFMQDIKKKLSELTEKIPVYFMHGNRDFLVGKQFATETGVTLIDDPTVISLYGKRYLLMHGDSLCTLDKAHQRFRRITGHWLTQKLYFCLSLERRKKLAAGLRDESKKQNREKSTVIMDVTQDAVEKTMQSHNVQRLIHGHTHRCATHTFTLNNQPAKRYVLDAWHHHGQYLKVSDDGTIESITY